MKIYVDKLIGSLAMKPTGCLLEDVQNEWLFDSASEITSATRNPEVN